MRGLALHMVRDALVVAPHPDDEAIGAYGLIRTLRRRGVRVRVVVVADGAASHPGSVRWPARRLVRERRRETRRAMRAIGVAAAEIGFMGLADGRVAAAPARCWAGLRRAIATTRRGGLIVLPDAADAHPDHRAAAAQAALVAAPGVRRAAYRVWPAAAAGHASANRGIVLAQLQGQKRAAILRYRTQLGAITDDPAGFAISRRELNGFARPIECYRSLRW